MIQICFNTDYIKLTQYISRIWKIYLKCLNAILGNIKRNISFILFNYNIDFLKNNVKVNFKFDGIKMLIKVSYEISGEEAGEIR